MRHHRRVELLGKLTPHPRHRRTSLACNLLCHRLVVDGLHRLAQLAFKLPDQRVQLRLQLLRARLLLRAALRLQPQPFACNLPLAHAQRLALAAGRGQLCMQLIEQHSNVCGLRGKLRPRRRDDLRHQSQPLRNVQPRRSPRNPKPKLVGRRQRRLVEPHRRIQHPCAIGRVHLQRGQVRRNAAPRAHAEKVCCNRHRQRRALFGVGRRAQFVEQHQRVFIRQARDPVNIQHMRGKARQVRLDRLRVANVRVDRLEERQRRGLRGHGHSRLRHHAPAVPWSSALPSCRLYSAH